MHSVFTFPCPFLTRVPMNDIFLRCNMFLELTSLGIRSVCLMDGSVSPVKLDSSIAKSTAYSYIIFHCHMLLFFETNFELENYFIKSNIGGHTVTRI